MKHFYALSFAFFLFIFNPLQAQTSKDATVPVSATLSYTPTGVNLTWANPGNANILIMRRKKGLGGLAWQQIVNQAGTNLTSYTDSGVVDGQTYEYEVKRTIGTLIAYGYAHIAVNAPVVSSRGKIMLFVDSITFEGVTPEIDRLKNDLRGDGWQPITYLTGPSSTVKSVKDQIVATYTEDPTNVKSVLLLGTVPIPYSGNFAWDGHSPDHTGAWPSDAYYADVNGAWTDTDVENTTPGRDANDNIPGDGKFDQSYLPTAVELQIGRVDFRHINAVAFGEADQIGLMRRYLNKNHNWRIGDYTVENKALVDDNFGYFSGEAFASNGYRTAYPLVGEANIVEADFFENTNPQTYLLGYGCGGGNYNGAGGVGSSSNFATDTINIVFSNLFGSYFGDWDYENDPFMPSALASRGGILTCSWAGRPHWFNQALASGETIGYCTKETMNANGNSGYYNSTGRGGAHVALLGDPSIRAHVVKPATNLQLSNLNCQKVKLNWTASTDSVAGYHVYRAASVDGPYTQVTTNALQGTMYTDNNPVQDTLYYQVRAIQKVSTPGGGLYVDNSIGLIQSIDFSATPLTATIDPAVVNCDQSFTICAEPMGGTPPYAYEWSNNSNAACAFFNTAVPVNLKVTDSNGCIFQSPNITITLPFEISLSFESTNESASNAKDGTVISNISGGSGGFTYAWSNGASTKDLTGLAGGIYTVTVTDVAGCTSTGSVTILTTSGVQESALFQQFLLSPNPTEGLTFLTLQLHKPASLQVQVRDLTGRMVWESSIVTTDYLKLPIDLGQNTSGLYTLYVRVENEIFMRKLVLLK